MKRTNPAPTETRKRSNRETARAASKKAASDRTEPNLENCPVKKRGYGYSDSDSRCSKCKSTEDCKSETLKRMLNARRDLNVKIFDEYGDPFDFYDEGTSYWNFIERPSDISGDWLDELREDIKRKVMSWYSFRKETQEEDFDPDTIEDVITKLNPKTIRVLDNIWPEWKKYTGLFIDKVHVLDTKNLERLTYSLRTPYFIIDKYMNKMSSSAWKVFSYIGRRTTFDPVSNHFGRCWLSYEEIQEWTGIKTIQKYVNELLTLELIEVEHIRRRNPATQKLATTNQFTIRWFGEFKKLGVEGYKKRQKR